MSVTVIRDGETAWSLSGQHTGTTDIPLTEAGGQAATRLRPMLASQTFTAVLTSPLQRARETCELAGLGEQAVVDADLVEWNYGEYKERPWTRSTKRRPAGKYFTTERPGAKLPPRSAAVSIG